VAELHAARKVTEEGAVAGLRVFVSYSHKDERHRQKLWISLALLRRSNLILFGTTERFFLAMNGIAKSTRI